jgi:type IV secretory pathway VirJ component
MKKIILTVSILIGSVAGFFIYQNYEASTGITITKPIPLEYWDKHQNTPLIFLISGDAGFSTFTQKLSAQIYNKGYDIYTLNTKKYFWQKKTAEQSAKDFTDFLESVLKNRKNKQLIIIGYSFGADALPFIVNKMPENIKKQITKNILIDPSSTGSLEINLENYINEDTEGEELTIPEVNKMTLPINIILSDFGYENYPYKEVKINKNIYHLPGNHRFKGDYEKIAQTIQEIIKKQDH